MFPYFSDHHHGGSWVFFQFQCTIAHCDHHQIYSRILLSFQPKTYHKKPRSIGTLLLFFSHFIGLSLYCFHVVWCSAVAAIDWATCILHLTAIGISWRSNWETFLCHSRWLYIVWMTRYECYVVISSFLPATMMPQCHPSLVECFVLFDDRMK